VNWARTKDRTQIERGIKMSADENVAAAEAAGRLAWFSLVLKNANAEQYRRPRTYRVNPNDFKGHAYIEYLTRLGYRKDHEEGTRTS
jgi:hypothetical protein